MSAQPGSGPDWAPILGGLAALLTAAGGVWAVMTGAFRQKKSDQGVQTEQTLGNIWRLVEELQEERDVAAKQLVEIEARCTARIATLEAKVTGLEAEQHRIGSELHAAKDEVADLKRDLSRIRTGDA